MTYMIRITKAAENDLSRTVEYIDHVLLNPQAAEDLLEEAEAKIEELTKFPEKYALADDPVLKAWGVRFALVKNYLIFFVVSEPERKFYIVRFLYKKRNWMSILKEGFSFV